MSSWTLSLIIFYSLIIVVNLIFSLSFKTLLKMIICLAIIMIPAALFLFVGRTLPKKRFTEEKGFLKQTKFKENICKFTNVKAWKDKILVGGRVANFRMNKLERPTDTDYLNRYIYESAFAEWLHTITAFWGLFAVLIIFFIDKTLVLKMALPFALVFFYQNMCSTIIQWYMRPRITNLRNKLVQRQNLQ